MSLLSLSYQVFNMSIVYLNLNILPQIGGVVYLPFVCKECPPPLGCILMELCAAQNKNKLPFFSLSDNPQRAPSRET